MLDYALDGLINTIYIFHIARHSETECRACTPLRVSAARIDFGTRPSVGSKEIFSSTELLRTTASEELKVQA